MFVNKYVNAYDFSITRTYLFIIFKLPYLVHISICRCWLHCLKLSCKGHLNNYHFGLLCIFPKVYPIRRFLYIPIILSCSNIGFFLSYTYLFKISLYQLTNNCLLTFIAYWTNFLANFLTHFLMKFLTNWIFWWFFWRIFLRIFWHFFLGTLIFPKISFTYMQ